MIGSPGVSGPAGSVLTPGAHARLREVLRASLAGRSEPVFFLGDTVLPAASLWAASRAWVRAFRRHGVGAGDRVVIAADGSSTALETIVACWWEAAVAVPVRPDRVAWAVEACGARVSIGGPASAARWSGLAPGEPRDPLASPIARSGRSNAALMTVGSDGWTARTAHDLLASLAEPSLAAMHGARVVTAVTCDDCLAVELGLLAPLAFSAAVVVDAAAMTDEELTSLLDEVACLVIRPERARELGSALARCRSHHSVA